MKRSKADVAGVQASRASAVSIESLENRLLMHHGFGGFGFFDGDGSFAGAPSATSYGRGLSVIQFSQAPMAVQTGLDHLATTDGLAAPATTQSVFLGNRNGIETYTVDISGTGIQSVLTVDQTGAPVTAPTHGTTTEGTIPAAVMTEFTAIATALGLTAPASTDNVHVTTPLGGAAVYSIRLTSSSASTTGHAHGRRVSVNANGNPVGNQRIPFVAIPASIQTALNSSRPAGAAALAPTDTQSVSVRTSGGITTYSTTFTTTGVTSTVTVNASGAGEAAEPHDDHVFGAHHRRDERDQHAGHGKRRDGRDRRYGGRPSLR